jgi:hypothetical protein
MVDARGATSAHHRRASVLAPFWRLWHRLDGVRAANRLGARLGEAEVLHLPRRNELIHGTGGIFDGHVRIDAVLVQQVGTELSG